MIYILVWIGQSSGTIGAISPIFSSIFSTFFPQVSVREILLITILLILAYFVDIHAKYEKIGLPTEEGLVSLGFIALVVLGDYFLSATLTYPKLPSLSLVVLLPLLGLGLYVLSQGRERDIRTVVKVKTNIIMEVVPRGRKLIVIPKKGPIGTKVLEFKGVFDEIVLLKDGREVRIKKVLESFDDNGVRWILYSNEETEDI
ncbi:hypothetical protein CHITON_1158 [Thermococcus chitonophagus]|nr:hypothetical protein CHITON_1158 [Thermococcus chitonophagus]